MASLATSVQLCVLLLFLGSAIANQNLQRLNRFMQRYNNSKADIIFLMDVSGSVSNYGYQSEKKFISSLLSEISVQPIAARVAVISFASSARRDIDYIDSVNFEKNKCTFIKELAGVSRSGIGYLTNMRDGFQKGKDILDAATRKGYLRKNVNRAVVLLTDGDWNVGGNPVGVVRQLQDRSTYDMEVYSVGVGWVNQAILEDISVDTTKVVKASNFHAFADLAARIRGDQIEMLYQPVDAQNCAIVCDPRALCSCGTISGTYMCACLAGYHGNGKPGNCTECPVGTYKTYTSPDPCKKCPPNSSTKKTKSLSIKDCICNTGYNGNPGAGELCEIVKCPDVSKSTGNFVIENCGQSYRETCTFKCNTNHHVLGEVTTSRKLTCQSNGQWNAAPPTCTPVTCQQQSKPLHMTVVCSGNIVGSKCTFACDTGYTRIGPAERECRPDGNWGGTLPSCQIVTCSALRQVPNVVIQPASCITSKTNYNDGCSQSCKQGYTATNSGGTRNCQSDGSWSGTELSCQDTTPPSITCPTDIIASTDTGKDYKEITFAAPVAKDNTVEGQVGGVQVTQNPTDVTSPYRFPIGTTSVDYTATDNAGNKASCTFRVDIKDTEPPVFTYCPQDMQITLNQTGVQQHEVTWKTPTFTDNSGKATLTHSSHTPPVQFTIGVTYTVTYKAEDPSGRLATCQFFVKVEAKTCPHRDPPINGAKVCKPIAFFGDYCTVGCNSNYTMNGPVAIYYQCSLAAQWSGFPPSPIFQQRWPDCTVLRDSPGAQQLVSFYYFSGSCHDSKSARDEITRNFLALLDLYLKNVGQGGCNNPANARTCGAEGVVIKCGKTQAVSGRRLRRSTQNTFQIDVKVQVKSKEDESTQTEALNTVKNSLETLPSQSGAGLKTIGVADDQLLLNQVKAVGNPSAICQSGSVYNTDPTNTVTVKKCVSCLAGKYYDHVNEKCTDCPRSTYTEDAGLLGCLNCPKGTTTPGVGSHNSTDCRAPCSAGRFSATGLENCQQCAKGTYQPNLFGKSCLSCPGSTTTQSSGAEALWSCGMSCRSGTYSKTGVEPCLPCPRGYYSTAISAVTCIRCPGKSSTIGEGAADLSMCKDINYCASNPCINGATCSNEKDSFKCTCKAGYYGKRCEFEKNECTETPCGQGAVCLDLVSSFKCLCTADYSGTYCAERKKVCTPSTCDNGGTCVDTPDGFKCSCPAGYTGVYCERNVNECGSSPCQNGGYCLDVHNGFKCECAKGFEGEQCQTNIDDCAQNNLCLNGGECVDGVNSFTCTCAPGFEGERCQVNKDECASNPCRNGATCIDKVNTYECVCAATYYGNNCELRLTSSNFDVEFDKTVIGYANKTLHEEIREFSLAFWMKASSLDIESGTPISYAVEQGATFVDNALVLRDFNSFILVIMNKQADLQFAANDDIWHHVAVTWSSTTGNVAAYRDGLKVASASAFQKDVVIPAGGYLVLGQEQDEVGRNFSAAEAFDGTLSQLNMWKRVLSEAEIVEMSRYRCDSVHGDLAAWVDFTLAMEGVSKSVSFCSVTQRKFSTWQNRKAKSGSVEQESSSCPGSSTAAHCAGVSGDNANRVSKELNLFATRCDKDGYYCSDAKQKELSANNPNCPDFKSRFECPLPTVNHCSGVSCQNGGQCVSRLSGYECMCKDGYHGKNCQSSDGCGVIKAFANGNVQSTTASASFSCNAGYVLQGVNNLACEAGRWNNHIPKCVDVNECQTNNGGCAQQCTNTVGSFKCSCNKGYSFVSNSLCTDIDECSKNNGNCQDKCHNFAGGYSCSCRAGFKVSGDMHSCEDIDNCKTGQHTCAGICVNTKGSFKCSCAPGFNLNADQKSCDRVSCPSLGAPANGKVVDGGRQYESIAIYSCNTGFKLSGVSTRKCLASGQWGGEAPQCQAVACITLQSIYNGQASGTGTGYGASYTFTCLTGYRLVGDQKRTCQDDSSWSGKMPRCVAGTCNPLTAPANGVVIGANYAAGSTLLVRCNKGYMLTDPTNYFRTCLPNGVWSGTQPVCQILNCGAPKALANGVITGSNYNYGQKITYKCNADYGLSGPADRTCLETGQWSGTDPSCLYQSCGYPGVPSNGNLEGTEYKFDSIVKYVCDKGYTLHGVTERQCLRSGKWSDSLPSCTIKSCGNPGIPANGERTGSAYTYQSKLQFECKPGYSLVGSRTRQCQENGQWSGTQPSCQEGVCGGDKVGPSGTFNSPGYPNNYPNNAYCRWGITVSSVKKATVLLESLQLEAPEDMLEIRDGETQTPLVFLTGVLTQSVKYTSPSNKLDIRLITDGANAATLSGLKATYGASDCGGYITTIGATIRSPGYPNNYPNNADCTWQITMNQPFKVRFIYFQTFDVRDHLEVYSSTFVVNQNTLTDNYYGARGFLTLEAPGGQMFLRFTSDVVATQRGFSAVVEQL